MSAMREELHQLVDQLPEDGVGVPIPALDPPWPDAQKIAVVTSRDAPLGWRRFAHEVAAANPWPCTNITGTVRRVPDQLGRSAC